MSGQPHLTSVEALRDARTFASPSGRQWTVGLFDLPPGIGVRTPEGTIATQAILRFVSDDLTLDLAVFPKDWGDNAGQELVSLLRSATVPAFVQVPTTAREM